MSGIGLVAGAGFNALDIGQWGRMIGSGGGGGGVLYSTDVFSAYTYAGTGSANTINNGIDLLGKGGLVWSKCRSIAFSHYLTDTVRGSANDLSSDTAAAQSADNYYSGFNSNGYGINGVGALNSNGADFVSWTFRKAPKFFDVVTFTTNGSFGATIPHSLGITPGMVIIKATGSVENWVVWHTGLTSTNYLLNLNTTGAQQNAGASWITPGASSVVLPNGVGVLGASTAYVAYLFAHDTNADGIIQCGSYIGTGSAGLAVTLGFEPQLVLLKDSTNPESWYIWDTARGLTTGAGAYLNPSTSAAEVSGSAWVSPTATGFSIISATTAINTSASKVIYLAIRRPNKPPTTGTQVYNAIARTGTGAAATVTGVGFAPDLNLCLADTNAAGSFTGMFFDRLRGNAVAVYSQFTNAEQSFADGRALSGTATGTVTIGPSIGNINGRSNCEHFFRRAPGVFDVVCYTGTGSATTVAHSLGVVPELIITKIRNGSSNWFTYSAALGNTSTLRLNTTDAVQTGIAIWNSTSPTASVFSVDGINNTSSATYVAYLFATLAGISKVGSYTGNGSSQTINCGFTTGARFALIKRTDSAGDWYVWDSVRGIPVSGNSPHLSLNTTAAEVTTDASVNYDATGFVVTQNAATNINVSAGTYIVLAFA